MKIWKISKNFEGEHEICFRNSEMCVTFQVTCIQYSCLVLMFEITSQMFFLGFQKPGKMAFWQNKIILTIAKCCFFLFQTCAGDCQSLGLHTCLSC